MRLVLVFAISVFTVDPSAIPMYVWIIMAMYAVTGDLFS